MMKSLSRVLLCAAGLVLLLALLSFSSVGADPSSAPTDAQVDKLSLKELKTELSRRGITDFSDCLEKEHFRAKLKAALADPSVVIAASAEQEQSLEQLNNKPPAAGDEHDSADKSRASGASNTKRASSSSGDGVGDFDVEMVKRTFRKQREEQREMKKKLEAAGVDTRGIKFGDGSPTFLDSLFADEDKQKQRKGVHEDTATKSKRSSGSRKEHREVKSKPKKNSDL